MSAVAGNAFPCPSARRAIGTGVASPNVQRIGIWIRMQRLHAGDHAELSEARDVRGSNRLDVFDARTAIRCVVDLLSVLIGVEGGANSIVADGVSEKLKTAFIELGDRCGVIRRIPE